jgi:hypothetical protein
VQRFERCLDTGIKTAQLRRRGFVDSKKTVMRCFEGRNRARGGKRAFDERVGSIPNHAANLIDREFASAHLA